MVGPAPTRRPGIAAAGVAALLVIVPPVLFLGYGAIKGSEEALSAPAAVVSQLDVVVLSESARAGDRPKATRGWQIRPWLGTVKGDEVRWGPGGRPPPAPPAGADRVILLLVDGAPERLDDADQLRSAPREPGEVDRWLGLVDGLALEPAPTFALLKTTDDARLSRWQQALKARGGEAHSLQELAGHRTLTDLALRFGVLADTSEADLALAAQHRPALFFDSGERCRARRSTSTGCWRAARCASAIAARTCAALCTAVHGSGDLQNGADHLAFDPHGAGRRARRQHDLRARHPLRQRPPQRRLSRLLVVPAGQSQRLRGAAPAASGFVIAGITCHGPPVRLGGRHRHP